MAIGQFLEKGGLGNPRPCPFTTPCLASSWLLLKFLSFEDLPYSGLPSRDLPSRDL